MSRRPQPPQHSYSFDYDEPDSSYQPYRPQGYQVSSATAYNPELARSYSNSPAIDTQYQGATSSQSSSRPSQPYNPQQTRPQQRYARDLDEYQQQAAMPGAPRKPLPNPPSNGPPQNVHASAYSIPAPPTQSRGVDERTSDRRGQSSHDQLSRPRPAAAAGLGVGSASQSNAVNRGISPARYAGNDYYREPEDHNPYHSDYQSYPPSPPRHGHIRNQHSNSSTTGLAAAAASPGLAPVDSNRSRGGSAMSQRPSWERSYSDQPERPEERGRNLGTIDPLDVDDDDNDEVYTSRKTKRKSRLPPFGAATAGAGAGATAGSFVKGLTSRDTSGNYGQVPGSRDSSGKKEANQSEWLGGQTRSNKKLKWMVGGLIGAVIILAIIGGVVGVIISRNKSSSGGAPPGADGDDFTADSSQVQDLMNNPNLHKVFPGMDYTPFNTQYPACLDNPPSQNNVTMDVAVLSQLTPVIRLYGTDCQQTEMVMKALDILDLKDSVKVWLGVWQDGNSTTNNRQLQQLYDVLDKSDASSFLGVIVGNEVLFREEMTEGQLINVMNGVRTELQKRSIDIPVTTSDLGSKWTSQLVQAADVVMGNIHPFFAGIPVAGAAAWTMEFWQNNDLALTRAVPGKKALISEVGWPSGGGHRCANDEGIKIACTGPGQGSVAGVDEMNNFMEQWICPALANGTEYFWFETFDEPWKIIYNTPDEQWEDKWGLMDVARNLKPGISIPDCGGQTASLPSKKR